MQQRFYCWIFIFSSMSYVPYVWCHQCVQFTPEMCKSANGKCVKVEEDTAVCCHTDPSKITFLLKEMSSVSSNITSLYVYNATIPELNMTSDWFGSKLKTLTVTRSNISKINGIGNLTNIECLNLSGNSLSMIDTHLESLTKLRILDLSQNNLTSLPNLTTKNLTLDISGNIRMQCNSVWVLFLQMQNYTLNFENRNTSLCSKGYSFEWFNATEKLTLQQLEDLNKVEEQCREYQGIQKCHCRVERVDFLPGKTSVAFHVDCSNQQLLALPPFLPGNTTILNVTNNNISDLEPLNQESYRGIRELHADHNHIKSITALEYTGFINNFTRLSLRSNNLESIPTYFLTNAFDRNSAVKTVRLGGNKLVCDCNTVQVLKVWLMSNKRVVLDYDEVECSNYPKMVVKLDIQEVCVTHRTWADYIYYIIAGEVALLLFLISKVSYDYWVFKTAGYLPWPASKLPRLPCDWVFET